MKLKEYQKCSCGSLTLILGGQKPYSSYCPDCCEKDPNLKTKVIEHIDELLNNGGDFTCSVIEGGDWIFREFVFKNTDFRGSVFVGSDLSLADFEQSDLSFCNFIYCRLRRTKLFNSSLRFSRFNDCVIRQVDLTNADCRWMCANAGYILQKQSNDLGQELSALLARVQEARNDNSKRRIKDDECVYLLNAFGICKADDNCEDKYEFEIIKKEIEKLNKAEKLNNKELSDSAKERQRKNNNIPTEEAKSDWSGTTLQEADLSYAVFDKIIGHEINFDECDLHQATFEGADLTRSSFLSASFSRHTLPNSRQKEKISKPDTSRFKKTIFTACTLEGTNLCDLHFLETDFNVANMSNIFADRAVFEGCEMENVDMSGGVARGGHFIRTTLKGSNLVGLVAKDAMFSLENNHYILRNEIKENFFVQYEYNVITAKADETNLSGANLQGSDLENAKLKKVTLAGALLNGSSLDDADLTEAIAPGVSFSSCSLERAIFEKANLEACGFSEAKFSEETKFESTLLSSADFSGTELKRVKFIDVTCDSADFSDCTLENVDFIFNSKDSMHKKTDCTGVNFSNCGMNVVKFVNETKSNKDIDFSNSSFENSQINDISFNNIMLRMCSFDGSFLEKVNFNKVVLTSSTFKKILNDKLSIEFVECEAERTDFSQSTINEIIVENTNFQNSYFFYTKINKGDFSNTLFSGISIKSSELNCCTFKLNREKEKHISGCDFSDTIIKGSIFTSTNGMIKISGIFNRTVLDSLIKDGHDKSTSLKNICIQASYFDYAILNIDCETVIFDACNYDNTKININRISVLAFNECYLVKSSLDFQCDKNQIDEKVLFNGTQFISAELPKNGDSQCYVGCSFKDLYFLRDEVWIHEWSDAIFIQCSFEDIYFQDLFYQKSNNNGRKSGKDGPEEKVKEFVNYVFWDDQDAKKINSSIEHLICKLRMFIDLFKTKANDFYIEPLKRIENYVYNDHEQKNIVYEAWFDAKMYFIKRIRKEIMNQHHFDTASELYVLERDQDLHKRLFSKSCIYHFFRAGKNLFDHFRFILICFIILLLFSVIASFIVSKDMINSKAYAIFSSDLIYLFIIAIIAIVISISLSRLFAFCSDFFSIFRLFVARIVYSYGESFSKILYNSLLVILIFAFFYAWFGSIDEINESYEENMIEIQSGLLVDNEQTKLEANLVNAFTYLYFSAVTFSTLGLGDITPLGVCRALASLQALIGAFFIALFVFTFVRRMASRM